MLYIEKLPNVEAVLWNGQNIAEVRDFCRRDVRITAEILPMRSDSSVPIETGGVEFGALEISSASLNSMIYLEKNTYLYRIKNTIALKFLPKDLFEDAYALVDEDKKK